MSSHFRDGMSSQEQEAALRRAIDGVEPGLREVCLQFIARRTDVELVRLAQVAHAQAPFLLNLVGCAIFAVALPLTPLRALGLACFAASSLICMWRAMR